MPFLHTNGIRLHYLEYPGAGPLIIMMHGLTANAHAFGGIVANGLNAQFRIISVDLRGRGLTDSPSFKYEMEDHAQDILGLLDSLGEEKAIFCGHSFGGLLGMYLAAYYPKQVEKLIVLDAAARMNPNAPEMLAYRLSRLDIRYPSLAEYLTEVQEAPYNTFWSEDMRHYYDADVREHEEGGVTPRPQLANIIQASMGVASIPWPQLIGDIRAPVLLVNAPEEYNLGEPLLPAHLARETVELIPGATLITVSGNHQTMLYGEGAAQIADAITAFAAR